MAAKVGLTFAYDLAYRLQSQADVHATALVIDNTLMRLESGEIMLRPEPDFSLSAYDAYQVGAHLLLDLLRPLAERWPAMRWGPIFDSVEASLAALRNRTSARKL